MILCGLLAKIPEAPLEEMQHDGVNIDQRDMKSGRLNYSILA
jgi:hypothetical protein